MSNPKHNTATYRRRVRNSKPRVRSPMGPVRDDCTVFMDKLGSHREAFVLFQMMNDAAHSVAVDLCAQWGVVIQELTSNLGKYLFVWLDQEKADLMWSALKTSTIGTRAHRLDGRSRFHGGRDWNDSELLISQKTGPYQWFQLEGYGKRTRFAFLPV